jgi:hypothetical protein
MDAPLQDCTIEEQCVIVQFVWAEGMKPVEIHCCMLAQYGQSTISQRKVYEWVERRCCAVADSLPMRKWRKCCTQDWLREQPKSFFSAGIQKLVEWCNKCIVLQGDYAEKWYVKLLTVTSVKAVKCFLPLIFYSPSYISNSWYMLYVLADCWSTNSRLRLRLVSLLAYFEIHTINKT